MKPELKVSTTRSITETTVMELTGEQLLRVMRLAFGTVPSNARSTVDTIDVDTLRVEWTTTREEIK